MGGPRAPVTTIPGSLTPDSGDPETETGSLETEKRVDRIHDTLKMGLQIIPRSLVAPTRGAGGSLLLDIPNESFYVFRKTLVPIQDF